MVSPLERVPVRSPGTPEIAWQQWGIVFPRLSLDGCAQLLVVAPHPDDEILGVGGLMASFAATGGPVAVVAVTDGEASHPNLSPAAAAQLARIRTAESSAALAELGIPADPVRLGYPDGAVAASAVDLEHDVTRLLRTAPPGTWCLSPWRHDGHPDHDATAEACARACATTGVRHLEYPIWMWHWAQPGDIAVPWESARSFTLPAHLTAAKRRAVGAYRSQIDESGGPVLPAHVLDRLLRSSETVFE